MSNHLGNVLSDYKEGIVNGNSWEAEYYETRGLSANDYYAFGMEMPGRRFNSPEYRYGFNGKEKDGSGELGESTHYDYGFRIYNPGINRFLSVDPLIQSYPFYTPYQFAGNKPIWAVDIDGLEDQKFDRLTEGLREGRATTQVERKENLENLTKLLNSIGSGVKKGLGNLFSVQRWKEGITNTVDLSVRQYSDPQSAVDEIISQAEFLEEVIESGTAEERSQLLTETVGASVILRKLQAKDPKLLESKIPGDAPALNQAGFADLISAEAIIESLRKSMKGQKRIFEPNPKHGKNQKGDIGAAPKDGQGTLENSIELPGNTTRRVGIDKVNGEFVVFDEHLPNKFHGHVRTWSELSNKMQAVLRQHNLVTDKGKIR